jgi:hypothetical protein
MKLERTRPTAWRLTLHPLELATIVSGLRWITEHPDVDLPEDATNTMRRVLADYDRAVAATTERRTDT